MSEPIDLEAERALFRARREKEFNAAREQIARAPRRVSTVIFGGMETREQRAERQRERGAKGGRKKKPVD